MRNICIDGIFISIMFIVEKFQFSMNRRKNVTTFMSVGHEKYYYICMKSAILTPKKLFNIQCPFGCSI